jgi:hypothetical protein
MKLVLPPSMLTIEMSAPEPLPPVITRAGLERRCRAGAPRDLVVDQVLMTTTALGWPCLVMWCRRGGSHVLRAYYRVPEHGALVEVRATDRDGLERAWALLVWVRPDWTVAGATVAGGRAMPVAPPGGRP